MLRLAAHRIRCGAHLRDGRALHLRFGVKDCRDALASTNVARVCRIRMSGPAFAWEGAPTAAAWWLATCGICGFESVRATGPMILLVRRPDA
jgi:hypothetical protein